MSWGNIALKRIATLAAGGTPSVDEPNYWSEGDDGYAWSAISDMSSVDAVTATGRRISEDGLRSARIKVGEPGTILFSMYASLGHTAWLEVPAAWNQAILGLRADQWTDARFLRYSLVAMRQGLAELARSSTQANLNAEQVGNLPISRPPLDEQRRIADFLDAETTLINGLTEQRSRQRELLEEMKQSVTDHAIAYLNNCRRPRLGYLARVRTGVTVDGSRQQAEVSRPYLRVANVQVGYLDLNRSCRDGRTTHHRGGKPPAYRRRAHDRGRRS